MREQVQFSEEVGDKLFLCFQLKAGAAKMRGIKISNQMDKQAMILAVCRCLFLMETSPKQH